MMFKGIDVSEHQGIIDWSAVKSSGIDFAIIRAGYGRELSQKDKQFENNYAGCKSSGIPVGVYWYSYATSAEAAKLEAQICLEVLSEKQFEYPIYFDIEEKRQLDLGKEKCSEIAKVFLEEVEKAGYWVGIYSSKSHLENFISDEVRNRYAVWVAHYGVGKTTYNGTYGIWQKSSTGKINGISGNVDLDECYMDYPSKIKAVGLNGFSTVSTKQTKSVTLIIDGNKFFGTLTEE